jgi:hypothetical protein
MINHKKNVSKVKIVKQGVRTLGVTVHCINKIPEEIKRNNALRYLNPEEN